MQSSLPAVARHKLYRIREAIKQLEVEVKTDKKKKPALEELKKSLHAWERLNNEVSLDLSQ